MTDERIAARERSIHNLTNCPKTGKQVVVHEQNCFMIPDGKASWWYCPACGGWHVVVIEDKKSK